MILGLLLLLWPGTVRADTHLIAAGSNRGHADDPELRWAERDATLLADALERFGSFGSFRRQLLLGGTAAEFESAIAAGDAERLIVFFSGHADADGLHFGSTVLSFSRLRSIIERSPARVKLLVIDACRSGRMTEKKGAGPGDGFAISLEDRLEVEGLAIVTSSAESEDSQESEALRGSFFTHHLVNALLGAADRDRDSRVTLEEAYAYAYRETLRSTGRTRTLQHPTYTYELSGRGELVLTRLDDDRSAVIELAYAGDYLVFDERDRLIAELFVEHPNARYLVPPGSYLVQQRDGERAIEHSVELHAGETRTLRPQAGNSVRLTRLAAKGRTDDGRSHRFFLLGGAQGGVLGGSVALPSGWIGYRQRVSFLELGGDLRFARAGFGDLAIDDLFTLRAKIEGGFDFGFLYAGGGFVLDATIHRQKLGADERVQMYGGAGVLLFAELKLTGPFTIRLEGGPSLQLIKESIGGDGDRSRITAPLAWWIAGGPTWGF